MLVVHNIGSVSAQLQVAAIASLGGNIIRQGLRWCVHAKDDDAVIAEESFDARAHMHIQPGQYELRVHYLDEEQVVAELNLEQNTLTDILYIMKTGDVYNEQDEYFAESDPLIEHARRIEDRDVEMRLGGIATSLKNPYKEQGQEMGFQAHPLLANKAQFDGMPPEINNDPQKNEAAMEKQLQLQLQLQLQNQHQAAPGTTPQGM